MKKTITTCLLGTSLLPSLLATDSNEKIKQRSNVLFILLDDLGKEWVDTYGAEGIELPNVSKLAKTGMQFTNVYSMPQCTPSRVALMTGQYPYNNGWIGHWDVPRWGGGCHFDWKKNPGIAKVMKSAGYKTAAAGKWQINDFRIHPDAMEKHGFDDYCMWTGFEAKNPPSAKRYWNPYIHTKAGSKTYTDKFGEDVFSDFILDFMKKNKSEPMFIYYPMCLPHTPFTTTPLEPDVKETYDKYRAMVRYTDFILGKLVKGIDELGLSKNTIIIWTTDNGSCKKIVGTLKGRKVKGGKTLTTENGICAPFIVNCPGLVPEGKVSDALVDFTDILPTCAELGGASLPADHKIDGFSLANVFLGKEADSKREWILSMGGSSCTEEPPACNADGKIKTSRTASKRSEKGVENQYIFRDRVIRNKQYKLFIDKKRVPVALVDVINDPEEKKNLLTSSDPAAVTALKKLKALIPLFPKQDSDPGYVPQPPQEWDKKITIKSQVWKK